VILSSTLMGAWSVYTQILMVVFAASIFGAPAALAQSRTDAPVRCTINASSFWTTHRICDPLLAEASFLIGKVGSMSRNNMLRQCANDMAKKLPGSDQATYLNACEQLLSALQLP
jgi:hypothetical protein